MIDLRAVYITSDPQTTDTAELRCHDHGEWWAGVEGEGLLTIIDRATAHIRDVHRVHITGCACRGEHVIDQRCIPLAGVTAPKPYGPNNPQCSAEDSAGCDCAGPEGHLDGSDHSNVNGTWPAGGES